MLPPGDLSAPMLPPFLQALSARTGRRVNSIDMLCVAAPLAGLAPLKLSPRSARLGAPRSVHNLAAPASRLSLPQPAQPRQAAQSRTRQPPGPGRVTADAGHPRVARAMRYRTEVRAWQAPGGVVVVGRGVAGRWEAAIEVDPGGRGRGLGRELATAARHLVPDGAPVWAQIAPGNAASVRAFLAAGFAPVGGEALLLLLA